MEPQAWLDRRATAWAFQEGSGGAIEGGVVAQARDPGDHTILQTCEDALFGEAGVEADHGDPAQGLLRPIDEVEDEVQGSGGGVGIAGPQAGVEEISGLGDGGDDRVVHALVIVPIPGRTRLMATSFGAQAASGHLDESLAQDPSVGRPAQGVEQT